MPLTEEFLYVLEGHRADPLSRGPPTWLQNSNAPFSMVGLRPVARQSLLALIVSDN